MGLGYKNDWGQQDVLYPVSESATWKQAKILKMLLTSDFICHVRSQVSNIFYVYIATYQIEGNINVVVRKFSHVGKPWVHPSVCHECHVMEIISMNNPRQFNIVAVPIFRCYKWPPHPFHLVTIAPYDCSCFPMAILTVSRFPPNKAYSGSLRPRPSLCHIYTARATNNPEATSYFQQTQVSGRPEAMSVTIYWLLDKNVHHTVLLFEGEWCNHDQF